MAGQRQDARGQGAKGTGPARSAKSSSTARSQAGRSQAGRTATTKVQRRNTAASRSSASAVNATPPSSGRLSRLTQPFRSMTKTQWAALLLTLYGLGASIYLTVAHFDTHISLVCSDKGAINCEAVTTSSYSELFGHIPVAVLGLAFYVFLAAINSPWAWQWQRRLPQIRWVRLGSLVVGMVFVLYLIYAETQIGAICLWCTSVHVATFLLFSIFVFDASFNWGTTSTPR